MPKNIFKKIREALKNKRNFVFFGFAFLLGVFISLSPFGGLGIANAWPFSAINDAINGIISGVANLILFLPAAIFGISGLLLNYVINQTVVGMGNLIGDASGINAAWTALRDVANIAFIGILIWIGVSTILNLPGNYKNLLPKLIIIALLINFSLFITKFVIDVSNAFATEILQQIQVPGCDFKNMDVAECTDKGIAGVFAEELGILTIYDISGEDTEWTEVAGNIWKLFVVIIMSALFLLIAAFIFFAVAILLIIRFVVLLFLIVLSPLAFAAMVVPGTAGQAKKWWHALFNQSFFAPFFLLLLFVVLKIIQSTDLIGANNMEGGGDDPSPFESTFAQALIDGDQNTVGIIFSFGVIIALMVGALIVAKEMGIQGSGMMVKWGQGARKWGQGVAGRNTVGRLSSGASSMYNKMQSRIDNAEGAGGKWARGARRGVSIASGGLLSDRAVKTALESGKKAKFGSKESLEDQRKARRERVKEISETGKEQEAKKTIKGFKEGTKTHKDVADSLGKLSNKQLEELGGKELAKPELASGLKSSQFDHLMKSDELSQTAKDDIRAKREEGMIKRINDDGAESVIKGSNKDIAKLPARVLTREDVAKKLKPSVLNKLAIEGDLSQDQRNEIRRTIEDEATRRRPTGEHPPQEIIDSANWLTSQAGAIF